MKLHSLISAVVLGMAAHVQSQEKPVPPISDPFSGGATRPEPAPKAVKGPVAPQNVPVPKAETGGAAGRDELRWETPAHGFNSVFPVTTKPSRPTFEGSLELPAGKLGDVVAEIERGIGSWKVAEGAASPVMPNIVFSADSRDAAVPGNLRVQGVSPVQLLALACAAAGCSMEPIFAPDEETGWAKTQQIIGYRIARESAKGLNPMTTQKQFMEVVEEDAKIKASITEAAAKYQSLREKYSQNHPSVVAAEKDLLQLRKSLEAASKRKKAQSEQKIPSIVRGRLLDKDGKALGKKIVAFYSKDGSEKQNVLTEGPTSDDGTFQFELPVDKQWQAVFRENDESPTLRSEAMETPVADRLSGGANYYLELRVDGSRLAASLKPLLGGIGLQLMNQDDGVAVADVIPGGPASKYPEIKPGWRIIGVAEPGMPTVDTTNITFDKLVALLRGAPGTSVNVTFGTGADTGPKKHTVTLVRAKLSLAKSADDMIHEAHEGNQIGFPVSSPSPSESLLPKVTALDGSFDLVLGGTDSTRGGSGGLANNRAAPVARDGTLLMSGMALPVDNKRQIVRVYALGSILSGGEQESALKQVQCQELVRTTLDQADLGNVNSPKLSFHSESRVLVVKATSAQHEIIDQIIKALKENETQPVQKTATVKDNNTLPILPVNELNEKPSVLTPEVINPNKSGR